MTETIIKRAIGAALFASILVVVVPWLFDGSGDVLNDSRPTSVAIQNENHAKLQRIEETANLQRKQLFDVLQQSAIKRDAAGRLVSESDIAVPLVPQASTESTTEPPNESEKPIQHKPIGEMIVQPSSQLQQVQEEQQESKSGQGPQSTTDPKNQPGDLVATTSGDWVVQIGLFTRQGSAQRLKMQLVESGEKDTFVQTVRLNGKNYDGVFAGPYTDKNEAELVGQRIDKEIDVKPFVRRFADIAR